MSMPVQCLLLLKGYHQVLLILQQKISLYKINTHVEKSSILYHCTQKKKTEATSEKKVYGDRQCVKNRTEQEKIDEFKHRSSLLCESN